MKLQEETVDKSVTSVIPEAKSEDVAEEAAKQFMESIEKMEYLMGKVSSTGVRRVLMIVATFPYIGERQNEVKNAYEMELLKTALHMEGLKQQFATAQQLQEIQKEVGEKAADNIMKTVEKM